MKLVQHVEVDPSWPEYGVRGDGTPIRLADVETILPAGGERSSVYFVNPDGFKVWPWKGAGYYVDDDGTPMAAVFDVVPLPRHRLESLGFTDEKIWQVYVELFPDDAGGLSLDGPDVSERQVRRRKVYDAICAVAYKRG